MSKFQDKIDKLKEQESKWMFWANLNKPLVWLSVGSVIAMTASPIIHNGLYMAGVVGEQSAYLVAGLTTIASLSGVLFAGVMCDDKVKSIRSDIENCKRKEAWDLKKEDRIEWIKEQFVSLTPEKQAQIIDALKLGGEPISYDETNSDIEELLKTINYRLSLTAGEIIELRKTLETMMKLESDPEGLVNLNPEEYSRITSLDDALIFIDSWSELCPGQIVSAVLHEIYENKCALEYYFPQIDWIQVNADEVYNSLFKTQIKLVNYTGRARKRKR